MRHVQHAGKVLIIRRHKKQPDVFLFNFIVCVSWAGKLKHMLRCSPYPWWATRFYQTCPELVAVIVQTRCMLQRLGAQPWFQGCLHCKNIATVYAVRRSNHPPESGLYTFSQKPLCFQTSGRCLEHAVARPGKKEAGIAQ